MVFLTQYNGAILGPVAKVLGFFLNILAEFLNVFGIMNVGITIILFTFLINGLMIPLTIKQQKFSRLQTRMAPELAKIQKKYKGKKDDVSLRKQQEETQAVYRKFGSSPTGGCLPLLITFPILLALYRVIYHIPAYVDLYYNLYDGAVSGIMGVDNYAGLLEKWDQMPSLTQSLQVAVSDWGSASHQVVQNNLVELLSQFKASDWDNLQNLFKSYPDVVTAIGDTKEHVMAANQFIGGLTVVDQPGFGFPGIIIPLLAGGFQFLQVKLMSPSSANTDSDNPAMASMKMMNTTMPIMSIFMCAFFPVGVGLYWIAGSVFRIIQQFFVNKYLDHVSVDELIEKNVEKQNKKLKRLEKSGIDTKRMEEISKTRTSSIAKNSKSNNSSKSTDNNKQTKTEPTDYKQTTDKTVEANSIAAVANLLSRKNGEKGDR